MPGKKQGGMDISAVAGSSSSSGKKSSSGKATGKKSEQFDEPKVKQFIENYYKLMNVHPEVNKRSTVETIYEKYKKLNDVKKSRIIPVGPVKNKNGEIEIKPEHEVGLQPKVLLIDDEIRTWDEQGLPIQKGRYQVIAYVFPGQMKKDSPEHKNPELYVKSFIKLLIQKFSNNSALNSMPAASLFFFLDLAPQAKGAVYGATPAILTAKPKSKKEKNAKDRNAYEWVIFDAKSTMRAIKKYSDQFNRQNASATPRGSGESMITLFTHGTTLFQIDDDWWVPSAGTYRFHPDAKQSYIENKTPKKTAAKEDEKKGDDDEPKPPAAKVTKKRPSRDRDELDDDEEEDDEDEEENQKSAESDDNGNSEDSDELGRSAKRPRTAKSAASNLSSHGKLPVLMNPGVREKPSSSSSLPPLPISSFPPVPASSSSSSSSSSESALEILGEGSIHQLVELLGSDGQPLFSQDFHDQLHGMLRQRLTEMFDSVADHVKDDRLSLGHKFVSAEYPSGIQCFKKSEAHFLAKERGAAGLDADVRLSPHHWGLMSFLNQDHNELAKTNASSAGEVFGTAKMHWGHEAVTPLAATVIPSTLANTGLIKAMMLGVADALGYYESTVKKALSGQIALCAEEYTKALTQIHALRQTQSDANTQAKRAEAQIEKLKEQRARNKKKFVQLQENLKEEKKQTALLQDEIEKLQAEAAKTATTVNDDDDGSSCI